MGRVREYATGGKRYYVIEVKGLRIPSTSNTDPRAGAGGLRETATYAVLDRDWMHREMAVFEPVERTHMTSDWCWARARALAKRLNREEDRHNRQMGLA